MPANDTENTPNGGNEQEQRKVVNLELLNAVEAVNYDRVTLCLKKGADINTRASDGRTPLMRAVWKENAAMTRFLVQRGANILLRDNAGKNAFDINSQARDGNAREQITDTLLAGLPDLARQATSVAEAVRIAEGHQAAAAQDNSRVDPAPARKSGFTL